MKPMARVLAFLLLTVFVISGCQKPAAVGGSMRKKHYLTAVSLSPSTTEIVTSHMSAVKLLGRTESCDFPDAIKTVPVMGGVKPNYERIAKARPDVILYDEALYNPADIERLKQLNIELLPYGPKTVDEYNDWLVRASAKIGGETEISEYIDRIVAARTTNLAEATTKRRVILLLGGSTGEYMAAGTKTIQADFLRASGFEPVGPDADKFVTINVEQLLLDKPDAIVVAGDAARVLADPRLKSLGAIQAKRVVSVSDPNTILRAGARVDQLLSNLRPAVEGLFSKE